MPSRPPLRPRRSTSLKLGTVLVLLGLLARLLSHGRDGFDKGLFQGMCLACMVLGAYLLAAAIFRPDPAKEPGGDTWLPSRDER
ncbi:hypothetical protein LRP67_00060 [Nocardioides sp. cx-169]|uniref:hypothetical protein n=1 Tax=Nocardioides sp. cx-169 TaxID=2899080 RepID=UPI001E3A3DB6|nr:hypothetical protein [Nocardioides sp. cx-169]MCD4532484.1 hypothetical protein [Nocardioides sp. cx-169]